MRRLLPIVALCLISCGLLAPATASARATSEYTYTYEQMWRAVVRLVAVDFRFPIHDRDPEIGYLLFSYQESGRDYQGSLELVRTRGPRDTPQVRVTIQVPSMPTYVERMMIDRLSRKLTEDYGQPPPVRRPEAPAPAPTPPAEDEGGDDAS